MKLGNGSARFPTTRRSDTLIATPGAVVPLSPNTRLGPYEILSAIGAGGMGEVTNYSYESKISVDIRRCSIDSDDCGSLSFPPVDFY